MPEISIAYLDEHSADIHTYESFGRAVISTMVISAKRRMKEGSSEENVSLSCEAYVRANLAECLEVVLIIDGGYITKHVPKHVPR